jgi:fibronectin type III domain protein
LESLTIHGLYKTVFDHVNEDDQLDFLTDDVPDAFRLPDTLHSSLDNQEYDVSIISFDSGSVAFSSPTLVVGGVEVTMAVNVSSAGWVYVIDEDPVSDDFSLLRVERSIGTLLPEGNAWRTYVVVHLEGDTDEVQDHFHVLEYYAAQGLHEFTLVYEGVAQVQNLNLVSATGSTITLNWSLVPGAPLYYVQYKLSWVGSGGYTELNTTGAGIAIEHLGPGLSYDVRVYAQCDTCSPD